MATCKYCTASGSGDALRETTSDASEYASAVEAELEASREHWSELVSGLTSEGVGQEEEQRKLQTAASNREVFQSLVKGAAEFSLFWQDYTSEDFVIGEKIGEGGQSEIYLADYTDDRGELKKVVLKVLKLEGAPLQELQHQLPRGVVKNPHQVLFCCFIEGVRLLEDGRFAFQMMRYWGDLRKLIDLRMRDNKHQAPPFAPSKAYHIIRAIAQGMLELRRKHVTHRDLKASNVLVAPYTGARECPRHGDDFFPRVADYECSVGVVGTGFWRAPEILRALKEGSLYRKPELFSESADVYSFAMTCYEVLTGRIPFDDVPRNEYEVVFSGQVGLEWPTYVEPKLKALLRKCSSLEPQRRPTFEDIVEKLYD